MDDETLIIVVIVVIIVMMAFFLLNISQLDDELVYDQTPEIYIQPGLMEYIDENPNKISQKVQSIININNSVIALCNRIRNDYNKYSREIQSFIDQQSYKLDTLNRNLTSLIERMDTIYRTQGIGEVSKMIIDVYDIDFTPVKYFYQLLRNDSTIQSLVWFIDDSFENIKNGN